MKKNLVKRTFAIANMKALAAADAEKLLSVTPKQPTVKVVIPPVAKYEGLADKKKALEEYIENLDYTEVTAQMADLQAEEKKYMARAAKVRDLRNALIASNFKGGIDPIEGSYHFKYTDNRCNDFFWDISGEPITEEEAEGNCIKLEKKTGNKVDVPYGFKLDLGAVLYQVSNINIGKNGLNIKPLNIAIKNLNGDIIYGDAKDEFGRTVQMNSSWRTAVDSNEFIGKFFGDENIKFGDSFDRFADRYERNVNFETILKEAPAGLIDTLSRNYSSNKMKIHEILGFENKQQYQIVESFGLVEAYYIVSNKSEYIYGYGSKYLTPDNLGIKLQKYCEILLGSLRDEQTLRDNNITFSGYSSSKYELFAVIGKKWMTTDILKDNITFQRYYKYVVKEVVEQMYSSVSGFLTEHCDYLLQCEKMGAPYIIETNDVNRAHRVAMKNYKVQYSPEQKEAFIKAYEGFKNWEAKDKNFVVTAPTSTEDLKFEGTKLNHCVFSYVPKVIRGDSKVYFLRKDEKKPLITVEISGNTNKIVQAAGYANREITELEMKALEEFAKDRNLEIEL